MKPIPGYPGYYADEAGRVWSDRSGLLLAVPAYVSSGFLSVVIRNADGRRIEWIHRLILLAFLGERAEDAPCWHGKTGIRNNSTTNLRVSKSPRSLCVATIAAVLDALAGGLTLAEAARRVSVGRRTVSRIKQRFAPKSNAQDCSGSTISDRNDPRAV